jgi:hypothetical protein
MKYRIEEVNDGEVSKFYPQMKTGWFGWDYMADAWNFYGSSAVSFTTIEGAREYLNKHFAKDRLAEQRALASYAKNHRYP